MSDNALTEFETEFFQRRGLHPADLRFRVAVEDYQKALAEFEQAEGASGEQEAIAAWIRPVRSYATKLRKTLQYRGDPPLEQRGELFRQSMVGVIVCAQEQVDPHAKNAHYREDGETFLYILNLLCQMHPEHFLLFEHPHACLPIRRHYAFQLLCMRLVELLKQNGSNKKVYDDLLSLLKYWKIEIPITLSTSSDISKTKLKTRLRQWVCRVRKEEAKSVTKL